MRESNDWRSSSPREENFFTIVLGDWARCACYQCPLYAMHELLELASRAFLPHESMGAHESIGSLIEEALGRAPVKAQ
jgi:hypothetical protein